MRLDSRAPAAFPEGGPLHDSAAASDRAADGPVDSDIEQQVAVVEAMVAARERPGLFARLGDLLHGGVRMHDDLVQALRDQPLEYLPLLSVGAMELVLVAGLAASDPEPPVAAMLLKAASGMLTISGFSHDTVVCAGRAAMQAASFFGLSMLGGIAGAHHLALVAVAGQAGGAIAGRLLIRSELGRAMPAGA